MARPYNNNMNFEQLRQDADDCLLTYGTAFHPEIITSTEGIYMETQSGHRMMDFTSVRALLTFFLVDTCD
jgi:4-aminobutyrate aminotransferase-like enzyme